MTHKFHTHMLRSLGLPYGGECEPGVLVSHKIVGAARWSIVYEIVFQIAGRMYRTTYCEGATEQQVVDPWQWEEEVECEEVEAYQEVVTAYRPVGSGSAPPAAGGATESMKVHNGEDD